VDPRPVGGRVAVSVIVPVFNPGSSIEVCIDSLLAQSLPPEQYEVVFVDDGSTDAAPGRLDEVADKAANVRVFHEPPSGWPGRPRNIGIDNAVGDYVFFCDQDDWLAPEALARMADFADSAGADVLNAKTIGHHRAVPRSLYRENDTNATLWTRPLMSSLSPHKLFRRSFLDEHGLRFPEGRRRLEDHVLVVRAYFLAKRIAILADYPCYHHVRRPGDANAAYSVPDPAAYYGYLREVLDIIEAHTEPGPGRDVLLERPFTHEMLDWLSHPRRVGAVSQDYYERRFREVRNLMLERFAPSFADRLALVYRVRAGLVRDDRYDRLKDVNTAFRRLHGRAVLRSLRWDSDRWRAEIEATAVLEDGTPISFAPTEDGRLLVDPRLLPADLRAKFPVAIEHGVLAGQAEVVVVERASHEEWFVPAQLQAELREIPDQPGSNRHVVIRGSAEFDPSTLAGGRPLANGVWDVLVRFVSLGVELRARLASDAETQRPLPSAAVIGPRPVTVIPYLTEGRSTLAFDVGQRVHTLVESVLSRPIGTAVIARDEVWAPVEVDVAPQASQRSLRLQLRGGDAVVGRCEAAVVAGPDGARLRMGRVPKPTSGGTRLSHGAGRYSVTMQSRARDEPSLVGVVDINRIGRIVAADFSAAQRAAVVALPGGFGKVGPFMRVVKAIRRRVARLRHSRQRTMPM